MFLVNPISPVSIIKKHNSKKHTKRVRISDDLPTNIQNRKTRKVKWLNEIFLIYVIMDFPLLEKNNPVTLLQNSVFTLWQNCVHLSDPDDDSEIINITNQLNFILKIEKSNDKDKEAA